MYTPLRNLKPSREWVSFWNIFIRFRVVRGEKQVRPSGGWERERAWRAAQRSPAQILRHSSALDSDRRTRRTAARYHQLSVRIRPRSATGLQFYLRVLHSYRFCSATDHRTLVIPPRELVTCVDRWTDRGLTSRRRRHIWLSKSSRTPLLSDDRVSSRVSSARETRQMRRSCLRRS